MSELITTKQIYTSYCNALSTSPESRFEGDGYYLGIDTPAGGALISDMGSSSLLLDAVRTPIERREALVAKRSILDIGQAAFNGTKWIPLHGGDAYSLFVPEHINPQAGYSRFMLNAAERGLGEAYRMDEPVLVHANMQTGAMTGVDPMQHPFILALYQRIEEIRS